MANYKENYITSDEYIVLQQLGLPYEGFVKGVGYAYPLDISIAPPQMGIYNPPRFVPPGMDHYMYGRMQCLDTSAESIELSLKGNPEIEKDDKVEEVNFDGGNSGLALANAINSMPPVLPGPWLIPIINPLYGAGAVSIDGGANLVGSEVDKGIILMLRGKDKGQYIIYNEIAGGAGTGGSIGGEIT